MLKILPDCITYCNLQIAICNTHVFSYGYIVSKLENKVNPAKSDRLEYRTDFDPVRIIGCNDEGDNAEIDFIIERPNQSKLLIEIKSTDQVHKIDQQKLVGFKKLIKDFRNSSAFIISNDKHEFKEENIQYLHWRNFLRSLCEGF